MWADGKSDSWNGVDDQESLRALRRGLDLGVTFFDTSDVYGTGHSERLLAQGLRGHRHEVVIATKFGFTYDEATRHITGSNVSPAYIRQACEASLRRLQTDYIDLYQLHCGASAEQVDDILHTLEGLHAAGKIRSYAWSTDDPEAARLFARGAHCTAVQHDMHVLRPCREMLQLCEEFDWASIARSPLASGLLSGKYTADTQLPPDDFRAAGHEWVTYFENGRPSAALLQKFAAIREVLTSGGRTPAQGALAWLWAHSERVIPIPGFKNVRQAEENCAAMKYGPLTAQQMAEIDAILGELAMPAR
jgi:aryl-alcohol dehydrogenase-like predicted oxidoreductase